MSQTTPTVIPTEDPEIAADRKSDHIALAFESQVKAMQIDKRFHYEPMLVSLPEDDILPQTDFLGCTFKAPLWVSSMTGGTKMAGTINHNLARAVNEFGIGMGLGSCRALLYDDATLPDFNVRPIIGYDQPLFANLGIAQLEQLLVNGQQQRILDLLNKLAANGLIVHINPLQEAMQPEGDRYAHPPLETISRLLDIAKYPVIVKEVGQGFGPKSMAALLKMPLAAIDFGASGGTNFALLELLRTSEMDRSAMLPMTKVGHTAAQMTDMAIALFESLQYELECKQIIVSGGIANFLDGYHSIRRLPVASVYGQASAFLRYAQGDYSELQHFLSLQVKGLALAYRFLEIAD